VISPSEAALLISKFESERRRLQVSFSSGDNIVLWLNVLECSVENGRLALISQDGAVSFVSLGGCRFEYHDERVNGEGISPSVREGLERDLEGTLLIFFPSGDRMALRMLRDGKA